MFSQTFQSQSQSTTPPTLFQTYILPSRPFRRRESSIASPISSAAFDHSSPTSPITPGTSYSTTQSSFSPLQQARSRRASYLSGYTSQLSCARCKAALALSSQIISKSFTGRHGRALLVSPSPVDTSPLPAPRSRRTSKTLSIDSEAGARGEIASRARRGSTLAREQDSHQTPRTRRSSSLTAALFSTLSSPFSSSSSSSLLSSTTQPSAATTLPNTQVHRPVQRHLVTGLHTVSDVSCMVCGSMLGWKYIAAEEVAQRYKVGKYILETNRIVGEVAWEREYEGDEVWEEDNSDVGVFEFEEDDEVGTGGDGSGRTTTGETGEPTGGRAVQAPSITNASISPATHLPRHRSTSIRWLDSPRPLPILTHQTPQSYPPEEDDEASASDSDSYSDFSGPNDNDNAIDDDDEDEDIVFDSQDEDECEALFAGVWSPALARERRNSRRSRRGNGRA